MSDMQKTNLEPKQVGMLAALGLVLLALVYFLFLKGGGEESAPQATPARPSLAQAEPEDPFVPGEGASAEQPVETFEVFASRDPFEPIVEGGATGADNGDADDPTDPGTDEPGDDPAPRNDQDDPDDPDPIEVDTGVQANEEQVAGRTVRLIDVFREGGEGRAQVQVDSTGYSVGPGEVFAENFQLVSTSGTCATMLYGDDQFTLCEGDEILK